jgi:membrane protease YdiL (CAAX protease family)
VSINEHRLLGDLFLMTLVSFFGVALPGYALARKFWPESGWNLGGNIPTSIIRPFDVVIAGGYLMVFVVLWKELPEAMAQGGLDEMTAGQVMANMLSFLLLAAVVPAVLFWRVDLREFFGLRWPEWRKIFWMAPAFVFAMWAATSLQIGLGWPEWVEEHYGLRPQGPVSLLRESNDLFLLAALSISAVVIAPVTEEVIFRGYLYPVVKRYSDRWFATVFTGVIFGVIHFNLAGFPLLALIGIVLVLLYEKTGSLWVTMACHAAFNATTVGVILLSRATGVLPPPP